MSVTPDRKKKLIDFCKSLGLKFSNIDLLDLAFHHRSCSNEDINFKNTNNERLEFLGDSVLGLVAADFLFNDMTKNSEGDLSKIKSAVVSEEALAPVALKFGLDKMLVLGRGEELSGGRTKKAILADCMEAVIGAYYEDQGFSAAKKYVLSFLIPEVRKIQKTGGKDYKSLLQELYQKKYKKCPVYKTVSVTGPGHSKEFKVTVHLGEVFYGPACGKSKKEAEQLAAKAAYETLI